MPAGNTPSEDFVAKFAAVKYVADPGTTQWRAYLLTNDGIEVFPGIFGFPVVNPLTLGALRRLPVGPHVVETYWSTCAYDISRGTEASSSSAPPRHQPRWQVGKVDDSGQQLQADDESRPLHRTHLSWIEYTVCCSASGRVELDIGYLLSRCPRGPVRVGVVLDHARPVPLA